MMQLHGIFCTYRSMRYLVNRAGNTLGFFFIVFCGHQQLFLISLEPSQV